MIYIDNNATTKIDEEVLEEMLPFLKEDYGNPGSRFYELGKDAKRAVEEAREKVAQLLNVEAREIIFTSSGSEANNFLVKGMSDYLKYYEKKGSHLITSEVEHKSIINSMRFLNGEIFMNKEIKRGPARTLDKVDRGFQVDFLGVDEFGRVELDELKEKVREDTSLVTLIYANNETGNLNDLGPMAAYLEEKDIFFHSDMTQAVGKVDLDLKALKLDSISFSSHKIYGPKGVGALYLRADKYKTKNISSLIHGGSDQESGYRAGTLPVASIVGFGKACEIAKRDLEENSLKIRKLEEDLRKILREKYSDIIFLTDQPSVPGVISFILPQKNNQIYLKNIANRVALSSGSACSIGKDSGVLEAMGHGNYSSNFLRIALGKYNTRQEIEELRELV